MKKLKKPTSKLTKAEDPSLYYSKQKNLPQVKEFTYNDFKKLTDKISFTQAEWAAMLHISERTLQRYAKDNHKFSPIFSERLVLIDKVLQEGKLTFGSTEKFYSWLVRNPYMLEGNLSVQALSSYEGIQNILTQLSRIQHGIFA